MRNVLVPLVALLSMACSGEPEGQARAGVFRNGAETRIEDEGPARPSTATVPAAARSVAANGSESQVSPRVATDVAEPEAQPGVAAEVAKPEAQPSPAANEPGPPAPPSVPAPARDTAVFAGGCFWCVEEAFDAAEGVISTTSGYTGGRIANPTYEQVSAGGTGHAEVVRVIYDPSRVSYSQLLDVFWRNVDPLTPNQQFCDKGAQYRSAIFVQDAEQRRLAEASRRALEQSGRFEQPIVTEINPGAPFYAAEEYHQDYYRKNPVRYKFYKTSCGRARRLAELWGKA